MQSLRVLGLVACLAMLSGPRPAHAQSEYEQVLEQALTAHAAGDHAGAQRSMERAHELEPSARTWRGLGIIAYAQARHVEAALLLEQALASSVRPLTPSLRAAVESVLAEIWARVARLRLSCEPKTFGLRVDGGVPSWGTHGELLLEAGAHRLTLTAPGRVTSELDFQAQAGSRDALHVVLAPVASAPAASSPPALAARAPAPETQRANMETATGPVTPTSSRSAGRLSRWTPALRNGVLAAGGGALVAGAALWLTAWRKFEAVDEQCRNLPSGACSHDQAELLLDQAHVRTYNRAGWISAGLGVSALATALALELSKQRALKRLDLAPTANGLLLRAKF